MIRPRSWNYWNDRDVLNDEPLQLMFAMREAAGTNRRKTNKSYPGTAKIAWCIRETPGGLKTVREWADKAFQPGQWESQGCVTHATFREDELLELFVEVFWLLYQHRDEEAGLRLDREARARGCMRRVVGIPVIKRARPSDADQHSRRHDSELQSHVSPARRRKRAEAPADLRSRARGGSSANAVEPVTTKGRAKQKVRKKARRREAQSQHDEAQPHNDLRPPAKRRNTKSGDMYGTSRDAMDEPMDDTMTPVVKNRLHREGREFGIPYYAFGHPGNDARLAPTAASHQYQEQLMKENVENFAIAALPMRPLHQERSFPLRAAEFASPTEFMDPTIEFQSATHEVEIPLKIIVDGQSIPKKPPLQKFPPMWSQSRQEICETCHWFRSYQSGVYHTDGIVKGYLLSAYGSSRDMFHHNGKVIISHGGGRNESLHMTKGQADIRQAEDQLAQDRSVSALFHNYESGTPLVLLMDDRYPFFPYDIAAKGVMYAVLGIYRVTYAWAEYQDAENEYGRVSRFKFRFQWCEDQDAPWWFTEKDISKIPCAPQSTGPWETKKNPITRMQVLVQPLQSSSDLDKCGKCATNSLQVYQQGWMCLKRECCDFWRMKDGSIPADGLTYTAHFLEPLPIPPLDAHDLDITPQKPRSGEDGLMLAEDFIRGWHCPRCGRLSSRYKLECWECPQCGESYRVAARLRRPNEFFHMELFFNGTRSLISRASGIFRTGHLFTDFSKGFAYTYELPYGRGRIHLIEATRCLNSIPDKIFRQYQEDASSGRLNFRRHPLKMHKVRGQLLTNYFSQNTGEPYHYVAGTDDTVPFCKAPTSVCLARDFIQRRAKIALNLDLSFNEVLSAAYVKTQKMSFHSDAERGLGPNIGSLSLGAPAIMHFRPISSQCTEGKESKGNSLSLVLQHGDVLIMEGSEVQKYYKHMVIPSEFRIAATARFIGETHS